MSTSTVFAPAPYFPEPLAAEISKPRKPRVWTVFATWLLVAIAGQLAVFAVAIAIGFGSGFVMGAMGIEQAEIPTRINSIFQIPIVGLMVSLLPFQLMMALVVVLAARRSKTPFKERLGLVPTTGRKFGVLKLTTLAAFTLSTALAISILTVVFIGLPMPSSAVSEVVEGGSMWAILLLSLLISIVPAVVEETVFRGYFQRRFLQRWSPVVAIGLTTLMFAVMHFDSLTHILSVIPLGLVAGVLAYRTNSVKPGMVVHATHNVGTVLFSTLVTMFGPMVSEESLGLIIFGTIGVLGLIGLPAVISLLRRGNAIVTDSVLATAAEAPIVSLPAAIEPEFGFDSQLASAV